MGNLSCFFISVIDFLVHILFQVQLYTHKAKIGRYKWNFVFVVVAVTFGVPGSNRFKQTLENRIDWKVLQNKIGIENTGKACYTLEKKIYSFFSIGLIDHCMLSNFLRQKIEAKFFQKSLSSEKIFLKLYHEGDKHFGSRSGLTFCFA